MPTSKLAWPATPPRAVPQSHSGDRWSGEVDVLGESGLKIASVDRLAQHLAHPQPETPLLHVGRELRGEPHHRDGQGQLLLYDPRGLEAVHDRHAQVHEHQVECGGVEVHDRGLDLVHPLLPVDRDLTGAADGFEEGRAHLLADGVILHYEHVRLLRGVDANRRLAGLGSSAAPPFPPGGCCVHRHRVVDVANHVAVGDCVVALCCLPHVHPAVVVVVNARAPAQGAVGGRRAKGIVVVPCPLGSGCGTVLFFLFHLPTLFEHACRPRPFANVAIVVVTPRDLRVVPGRVERAGPHARAIAHLDLEREPELGVFTQHVRSQLPSHARDHVVRGVEAEAEPMVGLRAELHPTVSADAAYDVAIGRDGLQRGPILLERLVYLLFAHLGSRVGHSDRHARPRGRLVRLRRQLLRLGRDGDASILGVRDSVAC
mmetsp:Transcript_6750/g.23566  ORF Transcript_6750/g.23566 Transcript_6750/m.23566 type:complete len:429 (-) Transcript_6750:84-1370(-)